MGLGEGNIGNPREDGDHTLGCVGTESKAQGICTTLRNPCWEVGFLQGANRWSAPLTCCISTPGACPHTCPSLAFSTSVGSRLLFNSWSWRP